MLGSLFRKLFGSRNDRILKGLQKKVALINALEPQFEALSDEELKQKTAEFKQRLADGATLDDLLIEAFATVREASKRVFGMRHFDVQLIGGMILNDNRIAEMRTGEGKTLTATLPAYLNALSGKGVHIVTVNDYLARRDAETNRPLFEFLGMTVAYNIPGMNPIDKRAAYTADITYGTNNEFGFDYLRDNMAFSPQERVQRGLNYAIVDEVDSILIDEARTPLIISGAAEDSSELYIKMNEIVPLLKQQDKEDTEEQIGDGDFTVDEKSKQVHLTERGQERVEEILKERGMMGADESLFSAANITLLHHVNAALRAHHLFQRDVDYIIKDGQVVIVDEHTGRTMEGRRWSEGLHQAVEAKEGVNIQNENQTLASITFQNYFRLYNKLAGMTGTADTEAFEFQHIYGLETVVIPTNRPMIRDDRPDLIFLTAEEKYEAIVKDIEECRAQQRPVLVGTISIESSELLSNLLKKRKIPHNVLNAKFHAQEAEIVAHAGLPGAVTIATNMAGRGTDVVSGGNLQAGLAKLTAPTPAQIEQVKAAWQPRHDAVSAAGGLHLIGTERYGARRIDKQLRGRAGRQGDPGSSRFYLSLEDGLMRIFASDRVKNFMKALGMQSGEAIEHRMVTNAIEKAQRKVEGRNFDIRKQLLEFDDVANEQRQIIYQQRNELLNADTIRDTITNIRADVVNDMVSSFIPPMSIEDQWDITGLEKHIESDYGLHLPVAAWLEEDKHLHEEKLREKILSDIQAAYDAKCDRVGDIMIEIEKQVMLQVLDNSWKDHLANMDHLRQGINLRSYAQKNPKQEYKREAFELFQQMLDTVKGETVRLMARVEPITREQMEAMERQRREAMERQKMQLQHEQVSALEDSSSPEGQAAAAEPFVRGGRKVGRNDPCPCGSGKKYKQCHGQLE